MKTQVTFNGVEYTLTTEATLSDRIIDGRQYHNAQDGDTYDFEMTATAVDSEGNEYLVSWIFEAIKGDEQELDRYDYSVADSVEEI